MNSRTVLLGAAALLAMTIGAGSAYAFTEVEIGGFHNVGEANAGKALGAEQRGRRIDDAFPVRRRLFPAYSHACIPALRADALRLTNYMTTVINRQESRIMMIVI